MLYQPTQKFYEMWGPTDRPNAPDSVTCFDQIVRAAFVKVPVNHRHTGKMIKLQK